MCWNLKLITNHTSISSRCELTDKQRWNFIGINILELFQTAWSQGHIPVSYSFSSTGTYSPGHRAAGQCQACKVERQSTGGWESCGGGRAALSTSSVYVSVPQPHHPDEASFLPHGRDNEEGDSQELNFLQRKPELFFNS